MHGGAFSSLCVRTKNRQILVRGEQYANRSQTAQHRFTVSYTHTPIWFAVCKPFGALLYTDFIYHTKCSHYVTCFGPPKKAYHTQVYMWHRHNQNQKSGIYNIASAFGGRVFGPVFTYTNIISNFYCQLSSEPSYIFNDFLSSFVSDLKFL